MVKLPSIPEVPFGRDSKEILDPVREILEVWKGDRKVTNQSQAVVTYQNLVDLGLITESQIPK